MKTDMQHVAAVVLAAGEGTRMKARKKNKVAFLLCGKPMIAYSMEAVRSTGFGRVVVVVRFREDSVRRAIGDWVHYVRQGEKKGTAAALEDGISALSNKVSDVIVMYGDDSAFYTPQLFQFLLDEHRRHHADVTLLSIKLNDPTGLGRIIRDTSGSIQCIVEEKVATDAQRLVKEVNTGCYCFRLPFLRQRLSEIRENPVSNEYYLTDIVDVALRHNEKIHVCLYPDSRVWFGVNTRSQWLKARLLKQRTR